MAPAGQHLLITQDRRVALLLSGTFPPNRPSADLLLVSMALSLGADAMAVVLSERGHDGATGATAVQDLGARVLTADQASSKEFGRGHRRPRRRGRRDPRVGELGARITELTRSDRG